MDGLDWNTVIYVIVSLIGGGGIYGGGKYAVDRIRKTRNGTIPLEPQGPVTSSGPIHTIVTYDECAKTRRGMNDSMKELRTELTNSIESLRGIMIEIKTSLAGIEAKMENTSNKQIREHEDRYHNRNVA